MSHLKKRTAEQRRRLDHILRAGIALDAACRAHDWSYQALADQVATIIHVRRSQDCWRKLAKGLTRNPNERTVRAVDEFLDHLRAMEEAAAEPHDKKRKRRAA